MERWEREYIDAVIKSKQAQKNAQGHIWAYEEGYDSSRWVELTLPDGNKYYVPKEEISKRSKKKEHQKYREYYEACWEEADHGSTKSVKRKKQKRTQRYYADKVSFLATAFKTVKRLLVLCLLTILSCVLAIGQADVQTTIVCTFALVSLGILIHTAYFILRCLFEGNLRL